MPETDREEILRMLREGVAALRAALEGIREEDALRRPAEGRWSVLECVEHVAASEAELLPLLRQAARCDASQEDRAREAKFQGLALNRARRIEAPDPVQPKGAAASVAEAWERFERVRAETVRFVEEFEGDPRWWVTRHPLITRPVNCYEMLLLMAMHPRRHAAQIVEIRAELAH